MSGQRAGGLAARSRTRGLGTRQLMLVGFHKSEAPLWAKTTNCDLMLRFDGNPSAECTVSSACLFHLFWIQCVLCILLQCRVIAVLDWELSTFGHPLSDLAHLSLFYFWPRTLPMINRGSHIQENTGTEERSHKRLFAERHTLLVVLCSFCSLKMFLIHLACFLNLEPHFLYTFFAYDITWLNGDCLCTACHCQIVTSQWWLSLHCMSLSDCVFSMVTVFALHDTLYLLALLCHFELFTVASLLRLMLCSVFIGIPLMEELISIYCRRRGIDPNLPNWNFFMALSFFKLAGIAQVLIFSKFNHFFPMCCELCLNHCLGHCVPLKVKLDISNM